MQSSTLKACHLTGFSHVLQRRENLVTRRSDIHVLESSTCGLAGEKTTQRLRRHGQLNHPLGFRVKGLGFNHPIGSPNSEDFCRQGGVL